MLQYHKIATTSCLTKPHKAVRLQWARDHVQWKDEWQQIVWSGEKKFILDSPDGLAYYRHDLQKEEKVFSKCASRVAIP